MQTLYFVFLFAVITIGTSAVFLHEEAKTEREPIRVIIVDSNSTGQESGKRQ